jgi:hypothetical protein
MVSAVSIFSARDCGLWSYTHAHPGRTHTQKITHGETRMVWHGGGQIRRKVWDMLCCDMHASSARARCLAFTTKHRWGLQGVSDIEENLAIALKHHKLCKHLGMANKNTTKGHGRVAI